MKSSPQALRRWRQDLLFAACRRSLISLMIRLICCEVLSNSFSWRFKFSRNSGESRRQSANSRAANPDPPLITIFLRLSLTHQTTENHLEILLSSDITILLVIHSCFYFAIKYLRLFIYWIIFDRLRSLVALSLSRYSPVETKDVTTLTEMPVTTFKKYLSSSNPLSHFFSRSDRNHSKNSDIFETNKLLATTWIGLLDAKRQIYYRNKLKTEQESWIAELTCALKYDRAKSCAPLAQHSIFSTTKN